MEMLEDPLGWWMPALLWATGEVCGGRADDSRVFIEETDHTSSSCGCVWIRGFRVILSFTTSFRNFSRVVLSCNRVHASELGIPLFLNNLVKLLTL